MVTKQAPEPLGLLSKLDADAQVTAQRELDEEQIKRDQWARYRSLIHRHSELTADEASAAANAGDAVGLKPADLAAHCKIVDRWRMLSDRAAKRESAGEAVRTHRERRKALEKQLKRDIAAENKLLGKAEQDLSRAMEAERGIEELRRQHPNLFEGIAVSS